jgi:Cytidylate kinase
METRARMRRWSCSPHHRQLLSGRGNPDCASQRRSTTRCGRAEGPDMDEKKAARVHPTNVFPETDFKYYLDAHLEERSRRRAAEGVQENLAARDQRDSQRATAPLMVALGAKVINTSQQTAEQTSALILEDIRSRLGEQTRV